MHWCGEGCRNSPRLRDCSRSGVFLLFAGRKVKPKEDAKQRLLSCGQLALRLKPQNGPPDLLPGNPIHR
jgi:hypothetical protein